MLTIPRPGRGCEGLYGVGSATSAFPGFVSGCNWPVRAHIQEKRGQKRTHNDRQQMAGDSSEGQGLLYSSQQARAAKPAGDGSDDRAQLLESTSPAARARPSCCALVSAIVTLHVALLACIGAILAVAIIAVVCVFFLAAEPASFRPRFHITPPSGWMVSAILLLVRCSYTVSCSQLL